LTADQGNGNSQCNQAVLLHHGHGIERNFCDATTFFELSDQGNSHRQYLYGLCSPNGIGTGRNNPRISMMIGVKMILADVQETELAVNEMLLKPSNVINSQRTNCRAMAQTIMVDVCHMILELNEICSRR
jgi:TPR repeat protein